MDGAIALSTWHLPTLLPFKPCCGSIQTAPYPGEGLLNHGSSQSRVFSITGLAITGRASMTIPGLRSIHSDIHSDLRHPDPCIWSLIQYSHPGLAGSTNLSGAAIPTQAMDPCVSRDPWSRFRRLHCTGVHWRDEALMRQIHRQIRSCRVAENLAEAMAQAIARALIFSMGAHRDAQPAAGFTN